MAQSTAQTDRQFLLFPTDQPSLTCAEFQAEGFSKPACGIIYRKKSRPKQGMPLGALDTGYLGLDLNGTFGYYTQFNSFIPMGGPFKTPYLGLTVGDQTWTLSDPEEFAGSFMITNVLIPTEIHYWGHYPIADLEYEMPGCPLQVGLRAWSPFILGDAATSNTPGAIFEVHLKNTSDQPQSGRIAFSFPGMTQAEAHVDLHCKRKAVYPSETNNDWFTWVPEVTERTRAIRSKVEGTFSGLEVHSEKVPANGYVIGVIDGDEVSTGGPLSTVKRPFEGLPWRQINEGLPEANEYEFGGSVSAAYTLAAGEQKIMRFVLAWYAPFWIGEGDHSFQHMYTRRYTSALDVAQHISREHEPWLQRIIAWQETIYAEQTYPAWLREALVNILHLFSINSLWATARPPIGPWCRKEEGLFGLLDGIVEVPAIEPIPDSFYANIPLVLFFPDVALSSMHGYQAYQFANGEAVWIWGGVVGKVEGGYEASAGTEFAMPSPGYQTATNGPSFVGIMDRYLQRVNNPERTAEFYQAIKRNTLFTMSLRDEDGPDGIISVPRGNVNPNMPGFTEGLLLDWFEWIRFLGMTAHIGGLHLAQLEIARRLARENGDKAFEQRCQEWIEAGQASMENKMWAGSYYLNYFEPATGRKSDLIFGYQLDGQWMARYHGLPSVFKPERVKITLETIKRTCATIASTGAANLCRPDGSLALGEGYGPNTYFTPEVFMLAATYLYEGDGDFGLDLARRCVQNLNLSLLSPWNQPNIVRGDNGDRLFGSHYVQNMMLWAVPAAIEGKDIQSFCAAGGLVDRVLKAANPETPADI